jgi:hypothetical protein
MAINEAINVKQSFVHGSTHLKKLSSSISQHEIQPSYLFQALTLQTCIREASGSNPGFTPTILTEVFCGIPQFLQADTRIVP